MKYHATIETPQGQISVAYTDADISATTLAALLRDAMIAGAYIAPSEIAAAAYREVPA